jgi:hypothetical protein
MALLSPALDRMRSRTVDSRCSPYRASGEPTAGHNRIASQRAKIFRSFSIPFSTSESNQRHPSATNDTSISSGEERKYLRWTSRRAMTLGSRPRWSLTCTPQPAHLNLHTSTGTPRCRGRAPQWPSINGNGWPTSMGSSWPMPIPPIASAWRKKINAGRRRACQWGPMILR